MEIYNYFKNVRKDVKQAILDNYSVEELHSEDIEEKLNDDLWNYDSVTGNASGSYTFSRYEAEENLCHNYDLLEEALDSFGIDMKYAIQQGAEYCDVTIRCYLLGEAIEVVLDELLNR